MTSDALQPTFFEQDQWQAKKKRYLLVWDINLIGEISEDKRTAILR